jgi:hypothetical protein
MVTPSFESLSNGSNPSLPYRDEEEIEEEEEYAFGLGAS